jgi:cytochrome c-type biogenesis protein CcmH/NrfG
MIDSPLDLLVASDTLNSTQIDEMTKQLEEKLKESPNDVQAWLTLGNGYYLRGKIKQAITTFEKAIHVRPQVPYFHYYLGICLYRSARINEAIRELQKVSELMPSMLMANYWLGIAYFHKGAYQESRKAFESFLDKSSESSIAHYHAALACIADQDFESAQTHLEALVNMGSTDPLVYYYLGDAHFRQNRTENAIAVYRKGLELNPGNAQLHKALSYLTDVQWP